MQNAIFWELECAALSSGHGSAQRHFRAREGHLCMSVSSCQDFAGS